MTVRTETTGTTIALTLEGNIGIAESALLRRILVESLRLGRGLIVDCSRVVRMDTAILATLVEALALARRSGVELALAAVPPAVMSLLELSRLDAVFPIHDRQAV